mgnify:CR=1 FL=1
MHDCREKLLIIKKELELKKQNKEFNIIPNIIAVSKTFPIKDIIPLINDNHIHFGENKVQEALEKWTDIIKDFKTIKLHMIGKLQTNKAKIAVELFDYIHSLDNLKLAEKLSNEQKKRGKEIKFFIQVNIGNEEQKSGVLPNDVASFHEICVNKLGLNIIGLMCLPPNDNNSSKYFLQMKNLSLTLNLKELSMGMSNDYLSAAKNGSTYIRVGSKIFGKRV